MEKKNVAIVFGVTRDYSFALANVLIGMKKHCKKFWDSIIVYHDNLSENDQKLLNQILECEFIKYDKNYSEKLFNSESVSSYSFLTLARFECFKLLNDYKKVIWNDIDILVQHDLSDLLQYGDKTGYAATLADSNFYVEANFFSTIPGYSMYKRLYNAGILVVTEKLDYNKIYNWCYEALNKWSKHLRWMDQGILNLLIQEFNIEVERIDILKYCCHPSKKEVDVAAIVHAYGQDKFWNCENLSQKFPEWKENDSEWKKIVKSKKEDTAKFITSNNKKTGKSSSPRCSVLMSIYDKCTYMDEAVNSILNQTFTDFEFLVVVEFSPMQEKIIEKLKNYNDSRIVIVTNTERLGFAASLNKGIDIAKGEFIARMDDDDISVPDRLEKEINFLEDNPDISAVGGYMNFFMYSKGLCAIDTDYEDLKALCLFSTPLYHPTVMFRKSDFEKNSLKYNPDFFTEDYELWSRVISKLKIANIPEVLLNYRASNQNTTITQEEKVNDSHLSIMKKQFKEYLDLDLSYDELQTINGRINISQNLYNIEEYQRLKESVISKVLKANEEINYCSQKSLRKMLNIVDGADSTYAYNQNILKRAGKKLLRPIYNKIMFRVRREINQAITDNNAYILEKLNNIDSKLKN